MVSAPWSLISAADRLPIALESPRSLPRHPGGLPKLGVKVSVNRLSRGRRRSRRDFRALADRRRARLGYARGPRAVVRRGKVAAAGGSRVDKIGTGIGTGRLENSGFL